MFNSHITIGLVPLRRDVTPRPGIFNWDKADLRCSAALKYIYEHFTDQHVSFVALDGLNKENVLYSEKDVPAVAERFRQANVDAIFLINGNFGNEEAAGAIAKSMGKPVLLWGPPDDEFEPDGSRYTDTQCGLFGIGRLLQRMNIPFTYIENCPITDPVFTRDFQKFIRVVCAVKNFSGMRVGQVGSRPKPFCSVIYNESELMEKFDIHVIPINLAVIRDKYNSILSQRKQELEAGTVLLRSMYDIAPDSEGKLEQIYAFVLLYQDLFREYNLDAVSAECWTAMQLLVDAMPCTAYAILADQGYIISCESDVHAAISMSILRSVTFGEKVPFLGEFTCRHPTDRNAELLWHCGVFAYSLHKEGTQPKCVNMRQWLQVKSGHYTVTRMDQDHGTYSLGVCECDSTEGPYTFGSYLWAKFPNLSSVERRIMEGPYIHHMAEVEGSLTDVLKEFCKYVPNLNFDPLV